MESTPAIETTNEPLEQPGQNSAEHYKNAFALYASLSERDREILSKPTEEIDAAEAAGLYERLKPILDLLHQGAASEHCDWGRDPWLVNAALPHFENAQKLHHLVQWAAAYQIPLNPIEAIGHLEARAAFGHHVATEGIGMLSAISFEKASVELMSQHAGRFDQAAVEKAQEFLAGSRIEQDVLKGFKGEMEYGLRQLAALSTQSPKERNAVILESLTNGPDSPARAAKRKQIEPLLRNEAYVAAELQVAMNIQTQLGEALTWPEARYQTWFAKTKALLARHPIAELIQPFYDSARSAIMASTVRREMLAAGLGMLNGRTPTAPDSVTGAPFLHAATATGFELRSQFMVKGKPVTMQFEQPR